MSKHLLAMATGPIQDFISAGRRTRDLWFGSKLLSDVSREVARAVEEYGLVIFPGPKARENNNSGIANVILARLNEGVDVSVVQARAKAACDRCWKQQASNAKKGLSPGLVRDDIWNAQLDGVIEFYAAWTPLKDDESDYKLARQRVMRLLAARRLVRDFSPGVGFEGVPKSSLDGARETVLAEDWGERISQKEARLLRLSRGEQLDIVGLTKRAADPQGFRSVSRVAADTWLRKLRADSLQKLKDICAELVGRGLIRIPDDLFPYEGTAVYRIRHRELAEETKEDEQVYAKLTRYVEELEKQYGLPDPYVGVLCADGDRMGRALSAITRAGQHRRFSDTLADFATAVQRIVETDHHGALVYSGGDDVLAYVPVSEVLGCARQLYESFGEKVRATTLSVGIAIGHFLEHMEDLRAFAKDAELDAKHGETQETDRDGLAVHVHPRGGSPVRVRAQWKEKDSLDSLDSRLLDWAAAYRNQDLSHKAAYDLKLLVADYENWDDALFQKAFPADAARALHGKRADEAVLQQLRARFEGVVNLKAAEKVVDELIVARRIAIALSQGEVR
jgi:CRISPR-associated protein Cmr2